MDARRWREGSTRAFLREPPRGERAAGASLLPVHRSLARRARFALGNDTGPMHLIAACGCPSVVLFSATSDPARTAPTGAHVTVLRCPLLADLSAEDVGAALPLDRDLKRPRDAQI